jgi:hypothetical protein
LDVPVTFHYPGVLRLFIQISGTDLGPRTYASEYSRLLALFER